MVIIYVQYAKLHTNTNMYIHVWSVYTYINMVGKSYISEKRPRWSKLSTLFY
jgi:hypothetical protein